MIDNFTLYKALSKGFKEETLLHFRDKTISSPPYLEFVLDCFLSAMVLEFLEESILLTPDSEMLIISDTYTKNFNCLNKIIHCSYMVHEKYTGDIEALYEVMEEEFLELGMNRSNLEKFFFYTISEFRKEYKEVCRSHEKYDSGLGKVILPFGFFCSVFIFPASLLIQPRQSQLYDIFFDDMIKVEYHTLTTRLRNIYNQVMQKVMVK
jgi:hypothetical protein